MPMRRSAFPSGPMLSGLPRRREASPRRGGRRGTTSVDVAPSPGVWYHSIEGHVSCGGTWPKQCDLTLYSFFPTLPSFATFAGYLAPVHGCVASPAPYGSSLRYYRAVSTHTPFAALLPTTASEQ